MKRINRKIMTLLILSAGALMLGAVSACGAPLWLAAPQNLRMEDEILYWDEVKGAEAYTVFLGDDAYYTDKPFLDTFELITAPGTYSMRVIAQGDTKKTFDSALSEELNYTVSLNGLMYREYDYGYEIVADLQDPPKGKLLIPEEINGKPVIRIAQRDSFSITGGFENCTELTSVILPARMNDIGMFAFSGCTKLTRIRLPDNLNKIPENTFADCASLWDCEIPDGVQSIEKGAFSNCSSLKEMRLPASVTKLGIMWSRSNRFEHIEINEENQIFYSEGNCIITRADKTLVLGCANSKIPNDVITIGREAFYGVGLTEIEIPNSVTTVEHDAFGNNEITSIILPESVTNFSSNAFEGCGLTSLSVEAGNPVYYSKGNCVLTREGNIVVLGCATSEIPAEAEAIGKYAFSNCEGLEEIAIPSNVKELEACAFYGCSNLKVIRLAYGLEKIGAHVFDYCWRVGSIVIPESVTEVSANAFYSCISTLYVSFANKRSTPSGWEPGWLSLAPLTLFGCTIGYDEEQYCYVISSAPLITSGAEANIDTQDTYVLIDAPYRAGYIFAGWATEEDGEVVFTVRTETRTATAFGGGSGVSMEVEFRETVLFQGSHENFSELDGIKLYAVWLPQE